MSSENFVRFARRIFFPPKIKILDETLHGVQVLPACAVKKLEILFHLEHNQDFNYHSSYHG